MTEEKSTENNLPSVSEDGDTIKTHSILQPTRKTSSEDKKTQDADKALLKKSFQEWCADAHIILMKYYPRTYRSSREDTDVLYELIKKFQSKNIDLSIISDIIDTKKKLLLNEQQRESMPFTKINKITSAELLYDLIIKFEKKKIDLGIIINIMKVEATLSEQDQEQKRKTLSYSINIDQHKENRSGKRDKYRKYVTNTSLIQGIQHIITSFLKRFYPDLTDDIKNEVKKNELNEWRNESIATLDNDANYHSTINPDRHTAKSKLIEKLEIEDKSFIQYYGDVLNTLQNSIESDNDVSQSCFPFFRQSIPRNSITGGRFQQVLYKIRELALKRIYPTLEESEKEKFLELEVKATQFLLGQPQEDKSEIPIIDKFIDTNKLLNDRIDKKSSDQNKFARQKKIINAFYKLDPKLKKQHWINQSINTLESYGKKYFVANDRKENLKTLIDSLGKNNSDDSELFANLYIAVLVALERSIEADKKARQGCCSFLWQYLPRNTFTGGRFQNMLYDIRKSALKKVYLKLNKKNKHQILIEEVYTTLYLLDTDKHIQKEALNKFRAELSSDSRPTNAILDDVINIIERQHLQFIDKYEHQHDLLTTIREQNQKLTTKQPSSPPCSSDDEQKSHESDNTLSTLSSNM